jgi:hypothetical protein
VRSSTRRRRGFPLGIEITCPTWGARKPKQGITTCGASERMIFHHTAGHFRQLDSVAGEPRVDGVRPGDQAFHMDGNGRNDSGHNFLVCRNGLILRAAG